MSGGICYNIKALIEALTQMGIDYKTNVSATELSLLKCGGVAKLVTYPKTAREIEEVVKLSKKFNVPFYLIGNGSNTLILDGGTSEIVISLNKFHHLFIRETGVVVSAGVKLPALSRKLAGLGYAGLEKLSGIPCSIGGATIKNAGCYGLDFSSCVKKVFCLNTITLKREVVPKKDIRYAYRSSGNSFLNRLILFVELELKKSDDNLLGIINDHAQKRKDSQPTEPSLGSVFLRCEDGISAGYYIDKAGLKGITAGGAMISTKHANFIVNAGKATAKDYMTLVALCESVVKNKFNVTLKREIDIIGDN